MELLEREADLEALVNALDGASAGRGSTVVVEGSAGLGKTRLLTAARAHAADLEMRVLPARGAELEQAFAYGVVRQLFEPVMAAASPNERRTLAAGAARHAQPLIGGEALPGSGEDAAFALLHGLYWLAVNLADRDPLCLVVDDLHWTDPASLRWLAYLANRIEGLPIALLGATRPVDQGSDAALAAVVAHEAHTTVRPGPLSATAVAQLAGHHLTHAVDDALAGVLREATAGNPLLLGELLGALGRSNGESRELAEQAAALAPRVVSRRIALELARLDSAARRVARSVAILGADSDAAIVAALADVDGEVAEQSASVLAQAGILVAGWPLRFVHPLVEQAVAETMGPSAREEAHLRAGNLLRERGAPPERVAAQLLRTAPGASDAIGTLRTAATQAIAQGAPESAAQYLRRALDEPLAIGVRADVLLELARAEALLGAPGAIEHLGEVIDLVDDPERRSLARLNLARALFWRARDRDAVEEARRGVAETPPDDDKVRRLLDAERLAASLRLPDLHAAAFTELAEMDVSSSAEEPDRMLLALKAYALATRGERREEAVSLATRALAGGLPADDAPGWALWGAVSALMFADEFAAPLRVTEEGIATARHRGAVYAFAGTSMVRASLLRGQGALVEAEADARAAVEALPGNGAMILPLAYGELAAILIERGSLAEAAAALSRAGADGQLPAAIGVLNLLRARAALRLAGGDASGALTDARACLDALDEVGFANPAGTHARSTAAAALLATGAAAEGQRLAREEVDLARRWGAPKPLAHALRALAASQERRASIETLEEALGLVAGGPVVLERARVLVALGSALRRDQRRADARDRLREGFELATRCGATALAENARAELVAAGAKPRRTALSGVAALTASERRVSAMAANGMTNREVAQALFVTPRTVEMHLSNAFRKLDIHSRTQLTAALGVE